MKVIEYGKLYRSNGGEVDYEITNGWDIKSSISCDRLWKQSSLELLELIMAGDHKDQELLDIISSISNEDDHWRWFDKAIHLKGDEYDWFHLYADEKPQAVCIIYHPKESALEPGNIFYIEYLAVAPWNRSCLIRERDFVKVGKTLVRAALHFAVHDLALRPGFCLHSLPGANGFYEKLEMINVPEHNKDSLHYFELPSSLATNLMAAA